ncbi:MAG: ComEC/Rec2 family competence protein [Candidatus Omnitrophota bacterium]|nr:ComEC/Rec2 family competence protein [Candidatus Omnitrophota bacterium]
MSNQNKKIIFVLPAAVISFILGILAAQFGSIPFFICYCLSVFLFFVCLFLKNDEAFDINLLGLVFFLGAAYLSCCQALPKNHISNYKSLFWQDKVLATGIIENEPQLKGERVRFILRLSEIGFGEQKATARGKILVQLFDPPQSAGEASGHPVSYGDELILEGNFFSPYNFSGKGNFNYRRYLARQGIYGVLNVKKDNRFEVIARHKASPIKEIALRFKQKIQAGFYANMPKSYAAVLSTMLLGDRSSLPKGILEVFVRTGTAHILPCQYTKMPSASFPNFVTP